MALRFRKSIKLAPGIRWNLSGSGSSWTFGPRGASIGVGQHGAFLNTGIPGTGLYSRSRLSGQSAAEPRRAATGSTSVSMTCAIRDDGTLYFVDADGAAVPDHLVEVAKKQNREAILGLIQRKCDEINSQIEALGRLHLDTPDPKIRPQFTAPSFDEPAPTMPVPQVPGLLDKLFRSRGQRIADSNAAAELSHNEAVAQWNGRRVEFDLQVAKRKLLVESLIYDDLGAMESFLEERLHEIVWPRETVVAIAIDDAGARVMLDVDLPEIEDMPTRLAAVPARGLRLSVKELAPSRVQRLYAEHVHGILFRLVGEVFAALPRAQTVVASGYSQRRDPATAQLRDEYLLSVRVARADWQANDFSHLSAIDVTEALARYDLRREMLRSGQLKAITPHAT